MMRKAQNISIIELFEYQTSRFPAEFISSEIGKQLWQLFDLQKGVLRINFPTVQTDNQWEITPRGWVGTIPLATAQHLLLQPKTPLRNLFRMWEYAYHLKSFHLLDDLVTAASLHDFFEHIAHLLATWVLKRGRMGFYREYLHQNRQLPYLRGRLLPQQKPATESTQLYCQFDEQSIDIPDNQILLFTLNRIARMGICRSTTQQLVRQAYHLLAGSASLRPFTPQDCYGRSYTRLNEDYRPLHALCRFFIEQSGPTHLPGDHTMKPFLINMPRLFEQFVAAWLKTHLPPPWHLNIQESIFLGTDNDFRFDIDLVLYDENGRSRAVLDTKYKTEPKPAAADIHQIIAYAKAKRAPQAILIYPTPLKTPLHIQLDDIWIHTLSFSLADDLQTAGQLFLKSLLNFNI